MRINFKDEPGEIPRDPEIQELQPNLNLGQRFMYLNPRMIKPLDSIVGNVKNGWDFVLLVTGNGLPRGGKSTFAQAIGYYMSQRLGTPFSSDKNIVFGGESLIESAQELPHCSVIINDEAREDLSSTRRLELMQKNLMDFFNECGKYNHIMIMVANDFFDFTSGIAKTRSEYLFDVVRSLGKIHYWKDGRSYQELGRGSVDFYDREHKRLFYDLGKKLKNDYSVGSKCKNFRADFSKHWYIDKETYEIRKDKFIKRDRGFGRQTKIHQNMINLVQGIRQDHPEITLTKMAEYVGVSQQALNEWVNNYKTQDHKDKLATGQ